MWAGSEISGRHVTKCDLYFSLATKHRAVVATSGDLHSNSQALLPCCARRRHRIARWRGSPPPYRVFVRTRIAHTERESAICAPRLARPVGSHESRTLRILQRFIQTHRGLHMDQEKQKLIQTLALTFNLNFVFNFEHIMDSHIVYLLINRIKSLATFMAT